MNPDSRLIVALDTADKAQALAWATAVSPYAGLLKLGLEFFLSHGRSGFDAIGGAPVFLDLKLHDIPNTVAGAVRSVLPLRPRMLTVHASGGPAMLRAACQAAAEAGAGRPLILAVSVLTSLDQPTLHALGIAASPAEQAVRLGRLALEAGADGLVCSPHEIRPLRAALGSAAKLVVPGIRPSGAEADDQRRTLTPRQAVEAGADWIVVGRPITAAPDPRAAAAAMLADLP